ncbi:MAG: hypothetical protein J5659_06255 [Clostridia bacterium]|nr:hypothetical protein [Clostridia bacterium]
MDKETLEIEKVSLERLLVMAGRDAEAVYKKKKKNDIDQAKLKEYIKNHPEDRFPIGGFVLEDF